jgi:hypothetical protein
MIGEPTTEELWKLFWKYEERASTTTADYRLAAATMAVAIAKIIASRITSRGIK